MADIPSFFSKADFIGILLPGYVVTFAGVFLLFSSQLTSSSVGSQLFSSVVFVVAGPAIGLTLREFQGSLGLLLDRINYRTEKGRKESEDFLKNYARVRINLSSQEREELDETEGLCDFGYSVGAGFLTIVAWRYFGFHHLDLISIGLLILTVVLVAGSELEKRTAYTPMIEQLIDKYKK